MKGIIVLCIVTFILGGISECVAVEPPLKIDTQWTGDLDGMVKRNRIRVLVPYSKTFYFLDGPHQRGLTYDSLMEFEKYLNKHLKRKTITVRVVIIPTKRNQLLPGLAEGRGDIAAGNLTITPERLKLVDFCDPAMTGVDEIVVTGRSAPPIKTVDDLDGKEIHVRASSSYYQSLTDLNERFAKERKKKIKLVLADEYLEDEDLLEMMNADLIPMIVIDSHKGAFWAQIFENITLHPDIKVRSGGEIAWAVRKKSPELKTVINAFVRTHRKGTKIGNVLFNRYLKDTKWVRNVLNETELKRLRESIDFFKKYASRYDFDWLMVAALAYQESRIDQSKRSPTGAIGVMQVLPSTAADPNVNIPNIKELESNIHAGVKYLRFLRNRYFEEEPMDVTNKTLFTFAAYNAGPGKVTGLRNRAEQAGFDPNVWFSNVEVIAAREIGRETVHYVSNIYKYYTAYRILVEGGRLKEEVKEKYLKEK
ncbi:MAG: lytic transglycosylase F [Nitrospiraceae bacterium]|nr:MAG: lytic transglycosylase F [Nitrospiraceae bacterium]